MDTATEFYLLKIKFLLPENAKFQFRFHLGLKMGNLEDHLKELRKNDHKFFEYIRIMQFTFHYILKAFETQLHK